MSISDPIWTHQSGQTGEGVLQELNDMKAESKQESKISKRTFWAHLGVVKPSPRDRGSPMHRHSSP